ncbi:transcriptional regulator [Hydrogenophaga sp.]|uniref:transcriptional regulator n=1 Tax=Hydrogenophaga sp. TaxID=1904254 RepID=UPI0035B112FF
MPKPPSLPSGHLTASETPVKTVAELGELVRAQRTRQALRQIDVAGLGNTGNRFVVELENGKPTVQLQKVLDLLDLLGLEVVIRPKAQQVL